jgi:hypothetical protein
MIAAGLRSLITPESMESVAAFCCDALFYGDTSWVFRRKEAVEILSENIIRHRQSVDFAPADLPSAGSEQDARHYVPMTLLRKEPGSFSRFDFIDESGRSLPLPTRAENAQVSAETLVDAARRVLGRPVGVGIVAELRLIAEAEKELALDVYTNVYLTPSGVLTNDADASERAALMANEDFRWLLRTLAYSSILVAEVPAAGAARRILRLCYDEEVPDVTRFRKKFARVGAWGYRLGWRGYMGQYLSPCIGAQSYHFELHAPPGVRLLEAGMTGTGLIARNPRRVHLYEEHAMRSRTVVAWAQFKIYGPGFVEAAALTAALVTASLIVCAIEAPRLASTNTSAPSLLLLFPGLVASYFARPVHALVTRPLNLARWALMGSAGLAYLAAGRLALISTVHPVHASGLRNFFTWLAALSVLPTVALFASWLLPFRLHGGMRSLWRRVLHKRDPGEAPGDPED